MTKQVPNSKKDWANSRNACGWECCPSGLREHWWNYRSQRHFPKEYRTGFFEYWWWELTCWLGFHKVKDDEDEEIE